MTMCEESSPFRKFILESAGKYLQTVVVVDDRIYDITRGSVSAGLTTPSAVLRKAALKSAETVKGENNATSESTMNMEKPEEVSFHDVPAANDNLAIHTGWNLTVSGIENLHLDSGDRPANAPCFLLVPPRLRAGHRGGFSQPVTFENRHAKQIFKLSSSFQREGRAATESILERLHPGRINLTGVDE